MNQLLKMADNTGVCSSNAFRVSNAFLRMFFEMYAQMSCTIEQTVGERLSLFPPVLRIPSSPCFGMMVWAMNFRGSVSSASPKLCFLPLPTVSTAYRFSTSFMRILLMSRLTTTVINGEKYGYPRLFRFLFKRILSLSLRDHTSSGAMVSFLKRKYKYAIKALVTRGAMNSPFFDIMVAFMHCSMIPGVMYMPDANPCLVLQFAMTILPQLHPGQIEMAFFLEIVSQLLNIALEDLYQIKISVFSDGSSDQYDKADPPKEDYEVVGGIEQYDMLLKFEKDLERLRSRLEGILREWRTRDPCMDDVSESLQGTFGYFWNPPTHPIHLPNLPPLLQEDPAAGASAD